MTSHYIRQHSSAAPLGKSFDSSNDDNSTAKSRVLIRYSMTGVLVVGAVLMATQQAQASSVLSVLNSVTVTGGVGVSKDILYGEAPLQDLDIYYPKPLAQAMQRQQTITASYPMVVFVHGGSWESGTKEDYAFVGKSFAQAGYVTAVINYRKAPEHLYPDYVKDTARAIAWSYHNAESFYANPQRLAVVGHSAGAFNVVAAVANEDFLVPYGLKPNDIRAVVGIAGLYSYDFRNFSSASAFPATATPDEVMPDRQIKGTQPPYLLLTAEKDQVVAAQNTINMTQALRAHGATVDNGVIKGASHTTSIGAMASPLRWVNDVRAQVLQYLATELQ